MRCIRLVYFLFFYFETNSLITWCLQLIKCNSRVAVVVLVHFLSFELLSDVTNPFYLDTIIWGKKILACISHLCLVLHRFCIYLMMLFIIIIYNLLEASVTFLLVLHLFNFFFFEKMTIKLNSRCRYFNNKKKTRDVGSTHKLSYLSN